MCAFFSLFVNIIKKSPAADKCTLLLTESVHFYYNTDMSEEFSRSEAFFGSDAINKIYAARVAVFGIGGVGGWCAEALARSGVGAIDLYDGDKVSVTNINRQMVALHSTMGRFKAEVAAERIRDINPACAARALNIFIDKTTIDGIDFSAYDYVADAVDTVSAKVLIIERCKAAGVPVISCMGAGNKLNIASFKVADISQTKVCPLARAVRQALKKRGISGVRVVYSEELPAGTIIEQDDCSSRHIPASNAFAPAAAGLTAAREIVCGIAGIAR